MKVKRIALAWLMLFSATSALAAITAGGVIDSATTWKLADSPVTVESDLTIASGAVLTIEPGVVVYVATNVNLTLTNGAIKALGTGVAPINITSIRDQSGTTPARGDWGELRFASGAPASQLAHVNIRFGKGLVIQSASPSLSYLNVDFHQGSAIRMDLNSSPTGVGNSAAGNEINGIEVPAGDISGQVVWGLLGIPYVVRQGTVSVGQSPKITALTPDTVQQGRSIDSLVSGTRLGSVESVTTSGSGLSVVLNGGAGDTAVPVRITATPTAALGAAALELQTAAGKVALDNAITVIAYKPDIAVSNIIPSSLRRGESKHFVATGEQLQNAQIALPASSGLSLSNLTSGPTQAEFDLAASASAAIGVQALTFTSPTANGSAIIGLSVLRNLPELYMSPNPVALLPNNQYRTVGIWLTEPDVVDRVVQLSTTNTAVAQVTPATLTIPAGQTTAQASVKGIVTGNTSLLMSSDGLVTVVARVVVDSGASAANSAWASAKVVKGGPNAPVAGAASFVSSRPLTVVKGGANAPVVGATDFVSSPTLTVIKGGANAVQGGTVISPFIHIIKQ